MEFSIPLVLQLDPRFIRQASFILRGQAMKVILFLITLFAASSSAFAILGGRSVMANTLDLHVAFLYVEDTQSVCTGTLIHPKVILTAAHCVQTRPRGVRVAFGVSPISGQYVKRMSTQILIHEQYLKGTDSRNDVALVLLDKPAPSNHLPVLVAPFDFPLRSGLFFTALGYGKNQDTQHSSGMGHLREHDFEVGPLTAQSQEFILDQTAGAGICSGDSGGPALMELNKKVYVVGIASAVWNGKDNQPADCSKYSIYMNVSSYQTWISENLKRLLNK